MTNMKIWKKEQNQIKFSEIKLLNCKQPKIWWISKRISFDGFKFIDIKSPGSGIKSFSNQLQIADEFHKSIIRKLKRRRVHSSFKNNIWGVDVADMQLLSKCKKGIRYLFCVIDLFSKYAWVVPLKEKK